MEGNFPYNFCYLCNMYFNDMNDFTNHLWVHTPPYFYSYNYSQTYVQQSSFTYRYESKLNSCTCHTQTKEDSLKRYTQIDENSFPITTNDVSCIVESPPRVEEICLSSSSSDISCILERDTQVEENSSSGTSNKAVSIQCEPSAGVCKYTKEKSISCLCNVCFPEKNHMTVQEHLRTETEPFSRGLYKKYFSDKFNYMPNPALHSSSNQIDKYYSCSVCFKSFHLESSLYYHMLVHKNEKFNKNGYHCSVCGRTFRLESDLYYHKVIHNKETNNACENKHFKRLMYTNENNYSCSVCGKGFRLESGLYYHMATHSKEKILPYKLVHSKSDNAINYACTLCSRGFRLKIGLYYHMIIHTKDYYQGKSFPPNNRFKFVRTRKPSPLRLQNKTIVPLKSCLTKHKTGGKSLLRSKTEPSRSLGKTVSFQTGITEERLDETSSELTNSSSLNDSTPEHENEDKNSVQTQTEQSSLRHKSISPCLAGFKLIDNYYVRTETKQVSSSLCDKTAALDTGATRHRSTNANSDTNSCFLCSKSFSHKRKLQHHMSLHAKRKPYSCCVCGKSFPHKRFFYHHMFLHIGQKPYSFNLLEYML